jgi:restriction system protein
MTMRRRIPGRPRRSGRFEARLGAAALVAWLLGARPVVVLLLATAVLVLEVTLTLVRRSRRQRRLRTLQAFMALTPAGFEGAVAGILRRLGYRRVRTVGGAGDLGADILCRTPAGDRVVVQCKRWAPARRVGSGVLQSFIGMAFVHHRAARALFVTTSSFTPAALHLARDHGIDLIDGRRLVELAGNSTRGRRRGDGAAAGGVLSDSPGAGRRHRRGHGDGGGRPDRRALALPTMPPDPVPGGGRP